MAVQIQLRNDTATNWTSANPTLAAGEIGIETNTGKMKLGNGSTAWNSLGYFEPTNLDSLTDVAISSASSGQVVQYNGTSWVNSDVTVSEVTGLQTALDNKANLSGASFTGNISTTGTVSGTAAAATAATAASRVGYMGIPASGAGASGAYTLVESDAGELVYSTSTRTVTIPANASVPFEIGTTIVFVSGSGATTTIAINSDTLTLAGTGTTGSRTLAAHGMATATKVASTTWYISGNGLT